MFPVPFTHGAGPEGGNEVVGSDSATGSIGERCQEPHLRDRT